MGTKLQPDKPSEQSLSQNQLSEHQLATQTAELIEDQSYFSAENGFFSGATTAFINTTWGVMAWIANKLGGSYEEGDELLEDVPSETTSTLTTTPVVETKPQVSTTLEQNVENRKKRRRRKKQPAEDQSTTATTTITPPTSGKAQLDKMRAEAARQKYFELAAKDRLNRKKLAQIEKDLRHPKRPPDKSNLVPCPWWGNANPHTYHNRESRLPPTRQGEAYLEYWPGGTSAGEKVGKQRLITGGGHGAKWYTDGGTHPGTGREYWAVFANGRWWFWDIGIADRTKRAREFPSLVRTIFPDDERLSVEEAELLIELNERGGLFKHKGKPKIQDPFLIPQTYLKDADLQTAIQQDFDWLGEAEDEVPTF